MPKSKAPEKKARSGEAHVGEAQGNAPGSTLQGGEDVQQSIVPRSNAPKSHAPHSDQERRQGLKEAVAVRVRQPEWVLAAALVVCLPMLPGVLSGSISIFRALVFFLIALLGCWAGGAILSAVLRSYGAIPDPAKSTEQDRASEITRPIELPNTSQGAPGAPGTIASPQATSVGSSPQGAAPAVGSTPQGAAPTIANLPKSSDPMENLQALTQPSPAVSNLQRLQGHDEPTGKIPTVRPSVKPSGQSADEMNNGT